MSADQPDQPTATEYGAILPTIACVFGDLHIAELDANDLAVMGLSGPHVQLLVEVGSPLGRGGTKILPWARLITAIPAAMAHQVGQGLMESAVDAHSGVDAHPDLAVPDGAGKLWTPPTEGAA